MATTCKISFSRDRVTELLEGWKQRLIDNLDASRDEFLASVLAIFKDNYLGIKQLQKQLDDAEINIDLSDLLPAQHLVHSEFNTWELKGPESVISIFKSNSGLSTYIRNKFGIDAYKYCIINTENTGGFDTHPIVENSEQLRFNISTFKQKLIQDLLPIIADYDLELYDHLDDIVFHPEFGADGELYDRIMRAAKRYLLDNIGSLDLSTFDVTNPDNSTLAEVIYSAFALVNFDTLLDDSMKDIVEKSTKKLLGDLNRTEYNLGAEKESDMQDLLGVSDITYENSENYVTPDINKIVAAIPMVEFNLGKTGSRFRYSQVGATLQTTHLFLLSQWLQLYMPEIARIFEVEGLDFQATPVQSVRKILKAVHDGILDYNSFDKNDPRRKFLKSKNTRSAIQTALSIYEYLFNDSDSRINQDTLAIQTINAQYDGTPRLNIINEVVQALIQNTAPAFIEHNMDGTIWDQTAEVKDNLDPTSKNYIQRFENSRARFQFLNPIHMCLFTECAKDRSEVAEAIKAQEGKSFREALKSNSYVDAVCRLLGISGIDRDIVRSILLEANESEEIHNQLTFMFLDLADKILSIKLEGSTWKYWNAIKLAVKNIVTVDYDVMGAALNALLNATPSPTWMSRSGEQVGVYRTTSLVFMFDHLVKRYKVPTEKEESIARAHATYKRLRSRSNFFVDNPGMLQRGDNDNYLSTVAIPLTMGNPEVNLEARKLPEFILDLHAFVGEFMSLMLGRKNGKSTPILAFQLGTYSDKGTLPQLATNSKTKLTGQARKKLTVETLLSKPRVLLNYMQAYLSTKSLDLVNHVVEDWKEIFRRLRDPLFVTRFVPYLGEDGSGVRRFIEDINDESTEIGLAVTTLLGADTITDDLLSADGVITKTVTKIVNGHKVLEEVIDVEASGHSALFQRFLENPIAEENSFTPLIQKAQSFETRLSNSVSILNEVLKRIPDKFMGEVLPQVGLKQDSIGLREVKVVENLHADKYDTGFEVNRVALADLHKDCTVLQMMLNMDVLAGSEDYKESGSDEYYYAEQALRGLRKRWFINGELTSFFEYLKNYFETNREQIQKMLSSLLADRCKLFDNLYTKDGKVNEKQLAQIYFAYLSWTSFLRHQALDLSVKEAYVDKAKDKSSIEMQRSNLLQTTTKRNNTLTAPVVPFLMDEIEGISAKTKTCVIENPKGGVFNTIGKDTEVKEYDGLGYTSPWQVRMEDASLCKKHRVSTKKTFITPVGDYATEELKWATDEITNKKIRESQGCTVNLLSIFKRMNSIPFDYDITRFWKNDGESNPIDILSLLGKDLFAREGFKYYRYDQIEKIEGKDRYAITRVEVDSKTGKEIGEPEVLQFTINTIYGLYTALNGINAMELTPRGLTYSENIMDFIYKVICNVGERRDKSLPLYLTGISLSTIYLPLRDSFIGIIATRESNKRGLSNIVTEKAWTDDHIPLSWTELELATGGEQLNAEHAADGSSITKGTLLMQDIAQKGYASGLVERVYKAIAKVMDLSSPDFDELVALLQEENVTGIQQKISEKIVKQLEINGTSEELQNLIAEFKRESEALGEPFILPLSLLTREVIKSYAPELNKNIIKQQDAGLMGTLNGSSGFIQVYNINGKSYTLGNLISQENIEKWSKYDTIILKVSQELGIPFNELIRELALLDALDDLDYAKQYFLLDPRATTVSPMEIMLHTLLNPEERAYIAQRVFDRYKDIDHFLGYQRINIKKVLPGETVIVPKNTVDLTSRTGRFTKILIDSTKKIVELEDTTISGHKLEYVMLDKLTPVDLQASVTQIETENGLIENEYTSYEAQLGARINRFHDDYALLSDYGIRTEADLLAVAELLATEGRSDELIKLQDALGRINTGVDTADLHLLLTYIGNSFNNAEIRALDDRLLTSQLTKEDWVLLARIQEDIQNFKNHVKSFGYTLASSPTNGNFDEYYRGFNPLENFELQLLEKIIREDTDTPVVDGVVLTPNISDEALLKALLFYMTHLATSEKRRTLEKLLLDPNGLEYLIKEHPLFLFKILPYRKLQRYQLYLDKSSLFDKITKSHINTALIIMPPIYRGQMKLAGVDILDVDVAFFEKAPTFYNASKDFVNEDGSINVDFIVRTFRGQYGIIITDDLTDPSLSRYGVTLNDDNIVVDSDGYRINKRNKERLYKVPKSPYIIKRLGKTETIIIKKSSTMYNDISELLHTDLALVSIQPFLTNFIKYGEPKKMTSLISNIKLLNTIPSFNGMLDKIVDTYRYENYQSLLSLLVQDLSTDYNNPNVKNDYEYKYRNSMFVSFIRSLDVIATRIPTQNMSSIMTMKVAAFTDRNVNDVFVTKWQQWLQGADYDIDKAFILGYNFDDYGRFITWSPLQLLYEDSLFEASLKLPLPTGKKFANHLYNESYGTLGMDPLMNALVKEYSLLQRIIDNPEGYKDDSYIKQLAREYNVTLTGNSQTDFDRLLIELITDILNRLEETGGLYISSTHRNMPYLNKLKELIDIHNGFKSSDAGIKNQATYLMHLVMNDPRYATTAYKSIDVATDAFDTPIKEITKGEKIVYNIDDGHTISSITVSGAVGKDDVGIGANGTKGQFTILNYLNRIFDTDEPLTEEELIRSHYFNITHISLDYITKDGEERTWKANIGPISDTIISKGVRRLYEAVMNGRPLYLYDRDASLDVGALLSKAADNAKDLSLDKMHAETDYFAMHIFLAMIGCPPDVIINYFRSPGFMKVIHSAQNDLAKGKIPRITYKTFIDAGEPLLAEIFACARELTSLALILSINQGIKVEEEEIVGQKQKLERAYADALHQRGIFDGKQYLLTSDHYFNTDRNNDEHIISNFCVKGTLDPDYIVTKMELANEAMRRAGITLKDPLDFHRFLTDEVYAEAIKCVYDVVKHNYNIFDIISRAPHFLKMLLKYDLLIQVYSKGNVMLDYEMNVAPSLYNKDLLSLPKSNPEAGEFIDEIYLPDTFRKDMTKSARTALQMRMFSDFLRKVVSQYAFLYSRRDSRTAAINCNFKTDDAMHSFIDFMNLVVIPKLFELYPDNAFLQGLEISEVEATQNKNVFFSFNENLKVLQNAEMSGITRLFKIKEAFKLLLDIKISDLVGVQNLKAVRKDMTVGDFLFIYNTIMKTVNPRSYDFGSLFTEFKPGSFKTLYYQFAKKCDLRLEKLEVDPHHLMAHIVKSQIRTLNGHKEVAFTDGTPAITLKEIKDGEEYTRYFIELPRLETIDRSIELSDMFMNALLNRLLHITNVELDCGN